MHQLRMELLAQRFDQVRIYIMKKETCPRCQWYGSMVIIFSHKECPNCQHPIESCCEGETMQRESAPNDPCEGDDVPN